MEISLNRSRNIRCLNYDMGDEIHVAKTKKESAN